MDYLGDTWGSKRALEISIALMLFPSFLIGCLPPYQVRPPSPTSSMYPPIYPPAPPTHPLPYLPLYQVHL